MRLISPYSPRSLWLRGNLHTHTTQSDGALSPKETCQWYEENGYDFLFLTDHNHNTEAPPSVGHLLILSGEEVTSPKFHLLALGSQQTIGMIPQSYAEGAQAILQAGGLAIIAHPYSSGVDKADLVATRDAVAIEIYNHNDSILNGKESSLLLWDALLAEGHRVWGVAVDDAHFIHPSGAGDAWEYAEGVWRIKPSWPVSVDRQNAGRAWVQVGVDEGTPESILEALHSGCFYSSRGPIVQALEVEETRIHVRCSPCQRIKFIGNAMIGDIFEAPAGSSLTEASFDVAAPGWWGSDLSYIRVECEDERGRCAWTNPIFVAA